MSSTSPLPIRLAQTLGITTTFLLAGQILTLSTFVVPRLLESPTPLMLQQWNNMYDRGKKLGPPLALVSATAYWYLAYKSHFSSALASSKAWAYVTAGALVLGIVPYTLLFLQGTNEKLKKAKEVNMLKGLGKEGSEINAQEENQTAHALVDTWGLLNLGRGMLVVASGVLGTWTVVN